MTPFALLVERCGLSQREVAEFLDTRIDTVKSWSVGRNRAPPGALEEMTALYRKIERAADETIAQIAALSQAHGAPGAIDLGLCSDDAEARSLGWPCVGAQAAAFGIVIARSPGLAFKIVPRGTTSASAAAADAHEA